MWKPEERETKEQSQRPIGGGREKEKTNKI